MNLEEIRSGLDEKDERLLSTSIFLGKMLAVGAVFQAVLYLYPSTHGLQTFLAELSRSGLELLGISFQLQGFMLVGPRDAYVITQDCLGWKSMAVFSALMFSSVPVSEFKNHLKNLAAGLGLIAVANYFRILSTVYLSYHGIISFDIIHTVFWKWGLTALVLIIWIYWLKFHAKTAPETI